MTRLIVLAVLLASCGIIVLAEQFGICKSKGCECQMAGHPTWIRVNCTIPLDQTLDIIDGDLPEFTTDLILSGGEALTLGQNSLSRLKDLRRIHLSGAKMVVLRQGAATDLNLVNAFLEIESCDVVRIEKRTFSNIRGPLTVTIRNCDYVSMEGCAFSWLLKMTISDVKKLALGIGAFTLDPTAANVGLHGPGMSIELRNLTAAEFPTNMFGSSAAEIVLKSVAVQAIRTGAFSANTYNVISATDCSFQNIEAEAFAQHSLINNFHLQGCKIHRFGSRALQSGVTKLNISHTRFDMIESGAINATVATVKITDSEFHSFMARGFSFLSWNKLSMSRNKFDAVAPYAIVAPTNVVHELVFVENEIESITEKSLEFIGQTFESRYRMNVVYNNNYFGIPCNCNISVWIAKVMGSKDGDAYETESFCTVDEIFARCFNVPQQNILFKTFLQKVCNEDTSIQCDSYKTKNEGQPTEIKNPRFPHKKEDSENGVSERNKKVIGIVIVTCLGCVIIVMFISLIKWMRRRGYCLSLKCPCCSLCERLCVCGQNSGINNARSISELYIVEYSERRRLNEPRLQEIMVHTPNGASYTPPINNTPPIDPNISPMGDKAIQTLPERLTRELIQNLKERLDNPETYAEAREMIEHLYDLIKHENSYNSSTPTEENIYDLPFQNTTNRIGKNMEQMFSIGTRVPSLDKLLPLSPYNRQTSLAHDYYEPRDLAVHLYTEIANDKEIRARIGTIPDLVKQIVPRGPYLKALREKNHIASSSLSCNSSTKSPVSSLTDSHLTSPERSLSPSTIMSSKSTGSSSSGKMVNRPLPEKPTSEAGEGTSSVAATQG